MTILSEKDSLVLIIDVQEKLLKAVYNQELIEKKTNIIIKAAKTLGIPIIVTEQYPKGLGETVKTLKQELNGYGSFFEKNSFSALETPGIFDSIVKTDKKQIVIMGIETHICVNQTANALVERGFEVNVVSDASGSRNEFEHNAGLNRMHDNGVNIITAEIAIFEWLRSSKHPKFKEVQELIK